MSEPTPEQRREWNAACHDIRMDAYYFGFNGTGERAVDLILSAVATAGKGSHHTDGWVDEEIANYYDDGLTHEERIQRAADAAASLIRDLRGGVA